MNPTKHIQLYQAKKLVELGFKAECEYWWADCEEIETSTLGKQNCGPYWVETPGQTGYLCCRSGHQSEKVKYYPAPDADDLMVALKSVWWNLFGYENGGFTAQGPVEETTLKSFTAPHPAWALGDLMLYLIENKLYESNKT